MAASLMSSAQYGHEIRSTLDEFTAHYHRERNHQGLGNRLIVQCPASESVGTCVPVP
jgi:hypothetical protein